MNNRKKNDAVIVRCRQSGHVDTTLGSSNAPRRHDIRFPRRYLRMAIKRDILQERLKDRGARKRRREIAELVHSDDSDHTEEFQIPTIAPLSPSHTSGDGSAADQG